jgi:hypothetical protein
MTIAPEIDVADVPDFGDVTLPDMTLTRPVVLTGKTGVTVRAGRVYWQGPPDAAAFDLVSCTGCRIEAKVVQNTGTPRTATAVRITPQENSPISAVKNEIRVGLIQGFGTGVQIGNANTKACDETSVADGTIAGCRDAIVINGGNAQLQYVDRMRLVHNERSCVNTVIGGVHLTNCTLGYTPHGVLVGHANPCVVLRDVFTEGVPLGVATAFNTNAPGTLQISGGWFEGIRWHHNAPVTMSGVDLYSPMEVEEGVVFGRGINLTNPNRKPADYFCARGKAFYDVAGSQRQANGTWRAWEYKGPGVKP